MNNVNRAILIGAVSGSPKPLVSRSNTAGLKFMLNTSVTLNFTTGPIQRVSVHTVTAWGLLASTALRELKSGQKVYVEGRIDTKIRMGTNGRETEKTEIVADKIEVIQDVVAARSTT